MNEPATKDFIQGLMIGVVIGMIATLVFLVMNIPFEHLR